MRPRPHLKDLQPYIPGKPIEELKRELGLSDVVKIASNENPLGPSPKAIAAIQEAAANVYLYPDAESHELKAFLSQRLGVPTNQIVLGCGSDELLQFLGPIFLGNPSDEVVAAQTSFSRYYSVAQLNQAKLHQVPLTSDYKHDLPAMLAKVNENTKLLFIANPNNPTGTLLSKAEIDDLLSKLPDSVTVILDEAYFEFAEVSKIAPDGIDYVKEGKNVIVLRTFSKTFGLAGLRVGYGVASPEIIDLFNRVRGPFNISTVAQAAAIAALQDEEHLNKTIKQNFEALDRITAIVEKNGGKATPSHANFVWVDMQRPSKPIFEGLLKRGVIVRGGDQFGCPTCLRISAGIDADLDKLESALAEVLAELG